MAPKVLLMSGKFAVTPQHGDADPLQIGQRGGGVDIAQGRLREVLNGLYRVRKCEPRVRVRVILSYRGHLGRGVNVWDFYLRSTNEIINEPVDCH